MYRTKKWRGRDRQEQKREKKKSYDTPTISLTRGRRPDQALLNY